MLANLITAIMMALGVASGTKATGNTFYDAEHTKPIQRAVTQQTLIEIEGLKQVTFNGGGPMTTGSYKYYLGTDSTSPNYNNQFVNVNNTIYECSVAETDSTYKTNTLTTLLQITNYYQTTLNNITISYNLDYLTSNNYDLLDQFNYNYILDNQYALTLIDNTLTQPDTAADIAWNKIIGMTQYQIRAEETNYRNQTATAVSSETYNTFTYKANNTFTINEIEAHETISIALITYIRTRAPAISIRANIDGNASGQIYKIVMTGYLNTTVVNQEIIDVPEMMYTILTMPFSFISTAFNLTLFPGTPYAINFSNLFKTIIAVFILLWLIKKVFH